MDSESIISIIDQLNENEQKRNKNAIKKCNKKKKLKKKNEIQKKGNDLKKKKRQSQ